MLIVFCLVTHSRIVSLCRSPLWLQSVPLHLNESSFGLEVGAADEGEICRVNLCAEQITVTATRAHGSSSNTRTAQHSIAVGNLQHLLQVDLLNAPFTVVNLSRNIT